MTMLRFKDLSKLKTKRIVFEDAFKAGNCAITLNLLKELSAKRRLIEESVNQTRLIPEAVAREMSGGLACQRQQELHMLDEYIAMLESFAHHVHSIREKMRGDKWESRLKIQWSSVLSTSCGALMMNVKPKLYQVDSLQYERAMTLFLYATVLRECALDAPSNDYAQSVTLLRKAAGVFEFLALTILPSLRALTQSMPVETLPCISTSLCLICLAEAQAISIMRAQERGSNISLLAKLNIGVSELFDQAGVALQEGCKVTSQFREFVSCSKVLYELRGYKYFAKSLQEAAERENAIGTSLGRAIGIMKLGLSKANKKEETKDSPWKSMLKEEMNEFVAMRKKYEHENNFLTQEKLPLEHELPLPESKRIMEPIAYQPPTVKFEKELCFCLT